MNKLKSPLSFVVLLACAVVGGMVVWRFTGPKPSPALTVERLEAARTLWRSAAPARYELKVEVTGREPAVHHLQVEGGEVRAMETNGAPAPEFAWSSWAVEGMFRVLDEELAHQAQPQGAFGVSDPREVFLDARFDEKLGVPLHFLRQVSGRPLTVEWRVQIIAK